MSFYGVYLVPAFKDTTFQYCYKGTYGYTLSDLIKNVDYDSIFIDIGANQGLYSVLAGKNPNVKHVVAFEPSNQTARLLKENLKCNTISNSTVIEKAISSVSGTLELNVIEGHSGKNSLRNMSAGTRSTVEKVSAINHSELDKIIPESEHYFIKIDVEGHEEVVINQLVQCSFIEKVKFIFCEIDRAWVDAKAVEDKLRKYGFSRFVAIDGVSDHYDMLITRD